MACSRRPLESQLNEYDPCGALICSVTRAILEDIRL